MNGKAMLRLRLRIRNNTKSPLFFADDGLLISRTEEEMGKMIHDLADLSHTRRLKINKDKSNILISNNKIQIED
ncbi:hypothetical protein E2C01_014004 [Portunus trituberculatus]|uniref:Reverse transcriptase domain-containing protein n=1 Tax=Portunus trituberculatus TaxID=210409 RepID=A0A5B7DHN5_PORTR|nr:hypothetical protein [Portunus trituberculatus]